MRAVAAALSGEVLPTGSVRSRGAVSSRLLPGYGWRDWWVQDAAAALPAHLIEAGPGKLVYDLCAAPGGKTMQLAASGARVRRSIVGDRLKRLSENLARTGLSAELVVADLRMATGRTR